MTLGLTSLFGGMLYRLETMANLIKLFMYLNDTKTLEGHIEITKLFFLIY